MKIKIGIFLAVILVMAVTLFWSRREIQPLKRAVSTESSTTPQTSTSDSDVASIAGTALPTVSRITLMVQDENGEELPSVELTPGEIKQISGTQYSIRFTEFYTHWNMDQHPMNLSFHEINPAVKVEVLNGDSLLYYNWGFKNMPFFRMRSHRGNTGGEETGYLAFTLVHYDGLTLPGRVNDQEDMP